MKNTKLKHSAGITLIALIITIIVMLILVGVTINVALNGGLFIKAKDAATLTQMETDREELLSAVVVAIGTDGEVDFTKLNSNLPKGWTGSNGTYTSPKGNTFTVDSNGKITPGSEDNNSESENNIYTNCFTWKETEGEAIVTGYTEEGKTKQELIIPSKYNNKKVTSIKNDFGMLTLAKNTTLKKITIPSTIEEGSFGEFNQCTNLEEVIYEESSKLKKLEVNQFNHCSKLKSVKMPDGLKEIENGAFAYCTSLESIEIPSTVTSINALAFEGCDKLTKIIIHKPDATELGTDWFPINATDVSYVE